MWHNPTLFIAEAAHRDGLCRKSTAVRCGCRRTSRALSSRPLWWRCAAPRRRSSGAADCRQPAACHARPAPVRARSRLCPCPSTPVPAYQSRAADHEAHTASKWRCARHWLKRRCNRTAVECLSAACVCILGLSAVRFATPIKAMKPNTVAFNAAESKHSHDRFRAEPNLPLLRGSSLHYAHPVELGRANPVCNPSCGRANGVSPVPAQMWAG